MWSKLQSLWLCALLLATLQTCSCAREKTITHDEVRSHLKSATSLLAQSDMLIDFLRAKRVTRNYAEAHASYLEDELNQSVKELQDRTAEAGTELAVHECETQLQLLDKELSAIQTGSSDRDLAESKKRLAAIQYRLLHAASSL